MAGNFDRKLRLPRIHFRVLLHAANMRHGTNGFTSLPKEGVLRIFSPWKIRRLRPGLNPRTWVPKASTLPLDHRSCYTCGIVLFQTIQSRFAVPTVCRTTDCTVWKPCKNWGSHSGAQKHWSLLAFYNASIGKQLPAFRKVHILSVVRISRPRISIASVPINQSTDLTSWMTERLIWTPVLKELTFTDSSIIQVQI